MKTKERAYTTIKRELTVLGTAWGGFRAKNTYPLSLNQEPKNLRDAQLIAGDFQDIESATFTVTTTIINETVQTEVLR